MSSRACISNKAYITDKNCKDLNYIIFFKYSKKNHYASTCTKLKKNFDILDK